MYLHEILSDISLALAVSIFSFGWAFGVAWCAVFYLIDRKERKKMACKKKGKVKK
jgi:hypothetical protein